MKRYSVTNVTIGVVPWVSRWTVRKDVKIPVQFQMSNLLRYEHSWSKTPFSVKREDYVLSKRFVFVITNYQFYYNWTCISLWEVNLITWEKWNPRLTSSDRNEDEVVEGPEWKSHSTSEVTSTWFKYCPYPKEASGFNYDRHCWK